MSLLDAATVYLKVFAAFVLILVGIRNRLGLALCILCGGVFMGLVFDLSVGNCVVTAAQALVQEKFLFLVTIVGSILVLSAGLERSGQSGRLMDCLSVYLTDARIRLVFFPALIGLLPMPGGAVFSAPMVQSVSRDMGLAAEDRAAINYWFRHVWELAWPLYPGIILTVALAEIPISEFLLRSWPAIPGMFLSGWYFLLRPALRRSQGGGFETVKVAGRSGDFRRIAWEGAPLAVAIAGAISLETLLAHLEVGIGFEWGVIIALLAAIGFVMAQNRLGGRFLCQVIFRKSLWSMLMVIGSIFIFKDIMQAADIVSRMAASGGGGTALFTAAVLLPFLVGLVAGINVAFVGATFPLLIGLLNTLGLVEQLVPYLVLASFAGFAGVMISPIHICFVLTCEYFAAGIMKTWRKMVAPCLGMLGLGWGLFLLY